MAFGKGLIGVGVVVALGAAGFVLMPRSADAPVAAKGAPLVQVVLPELQGDAVIGARVFEAKCAACHGNNGTGVDGAGPPLIHKIYEPSHHGDAAFLAAAQNGVRAHHWKFGNMLPIKAITRAEVGMVVAYIRAVQQANGIN
ncbi:MAG: cytochrome c [Paracoccaceae bacterium]|nr:cytochrome c [Paracoccaceae bacterium]